MPISSEESCDFIGGVGRRDARAYARKANPLRFRPFGDDLDRGYPWPRDYRSATLRLPVVGAPYHRDMRLLIVEDDYRGGRYLVRGLSESGHIVDRASDGETGLALALEGIYDVLIVDRRLPALDGIALVQRLREQGVATPVLMLSAIASAADRVAGLRAGCCGYQPGVGRHEETVRPRRRHHRALWQAMLDGTAPSGTRRPIRTTLLGRLGHTE